MERRQSPQTIAWFRDLYRRELLDLDPPYQRRSVWNMQFRQFFVETILLHYPAPAIFVHELITGDGVTTYSVVDGKQRLTTLFDFTDDLFAIGDQSMISSGQGKFFSQLDEPTRRGFWSYQFSVEYLPTTDESVLTSIFDRINRNVARLTRQELRHARFSGAFASAIEQLNDVLFAELLEGPNIAPASRRQMKDVEFTAQLALLVELGPESFSQDEVDQAYSDRDDEWPQGREVQREFREVVRNLDGLFRLANFNTPLRRLRNQADFYSLFGVYLDRVRQGTVPNPNKAIANLAEFFGQVTSIESREADREVASYYAAARSATNDLRQRNTRIRILNSVLPAS